MNRVILYKKLDKFVGFESSGHTYYDDYGKDIVCAAISVLTQTTVNSIEYQTKIEPDVKVDEELGYLKAMISNSNSQSDIETIQIIMKTLEIGIQSLIETYGDYVELLIEEV